MMKENEMKVLNFILAIAVLIFGIAVGWGVNNYITKENKEKVVAVEKCADKNHEDIKDVKSELYIYKEKQTGENNLIKKELDNINRKLDAIIDAINGKNGFLICDPIDNHKGGDNK